MNAGARRVDDELVNLGLAAVGAVFLIGLILRGAASLAATAADSPAPKAGITSGLKVLAHPGDPAAAVRAPGLSAFAFWGVVLCLLVVVVAVGVMGWRITAGIRHRDQRDPRRIVGTATVRDIAPVASKAALVRRGRTLRPSLVRPEAKEIGYLLGRSHGKEIWASVEDSMLIVGPPRSGKGLHLVINAILDAPGAVVTTSTRPDNIAATINARRERGPVAIFDPQHLTTELGLPAGLRWSPIRGCQEPLTAMIRATGLASSTGLSSGGVEAGGFWEGKTRAALQALL